MNKSNIAVQTPSYNAAINVSYEAVSHAVRKVFNAPEGYAAPDHWGEKVKLVAIGYVLERREIKLSTLKELLMQQFDAAYPHNAGRDVAPCHVKAKEIIKWYTDVGLVHTVKSTANGEHYWKRSERVINLLAWSEQTLNAKKAEVGGSPLALRVSSYLSCNWVKVNQEVRGFAKQVLMSHSLRKDLEKGDLEQLQILANKGAKHAFTVQHGFDEGGRVYGRGTQLRADSNKFMRSAIERATQSEAGTRGLDAICLQAADEIKCKDGRKARIKAGYKALSKFTVDAANWVAKPVLTRLAMAFNEVKETGKTAVFVYQDATSSGAQIIATLTGSEALATLVNLMPADEQTKINDLYQKIADEMNISRSMAKFFVMPRIYGAGDGALFASVKKELGLSDKKTKKLCGIYVEAEAKVMPEVRAFSKLLQSWGAKAKHLEWMLPDGFTVIRVEYDKEEHSVRIGRFHTYKRGDYKIDARKMAGVFPPAIVHSIDAYIMRLVIDWCRDRSYPIVSIHDSFGTSPELYFDLAAAIRTCFKQALDQINIDELVSSALGRTEFIPRVGDFTTDRLEEAINMFC